MDVFTLSGVVRARIARIALGLATVIGAAPAAAVVLPVEAELRIQIGTGDPALSVGATGAGVAIANGSGGAGPLTALSLPAGLVATDGALVPVTDPASAPIQGLLLDVANAAGAFAIGGGGHLGGAMGLPGQLRVCLFAPCAAAVANLTVPLTPVGVGGSATMPGAVSLTVVGAPWTTGTVMAVGLGSPETHTGYAHGPTSAPGSTARPGGSLQLVTPIALTTSIAADGPTPGFAFLTLRFVPEPASALLVAIGLGALAGARRRWSR